MVQGGLGSGRLGGKAALAKSQGRQGLRGHREGNLVREEDPDRGTNQVEEGRDMACCQRQAQAQGQDLRDPIEQDGGLVVRPACWGWEEIAVLEVREGLAGAHSDCRPEDHGVVP